VKSLVTERFTEGLAPEVLEHIYRPRLRTEFSSTFGYMSAVNKAHVIMLAGRRIVTPAVARKLLRGIIALDRRGPERFHLDPRLEDAFFNYETALIKLTGRDIGGRMHTARSRNDLGATIVRLQVRDMLLEFMPLLFKARKTALAQARRYATVVMPGYTHLQPAQPLTFGHYLAGAASALERDTHRIAAAYERTNLSPLGAGALAGTGFPIDRRVTARLLGFDGLVEHTLDAVASRDFALELLSAWAIFGVTCSRIAQDFYVWFSHEFATVTFPDRVAGTSSIMPQKKNPVVLEHLKGKPAHLIGGFVSAASAIKNTNFTNTIDGNREAMRPLRQAFEEARACAVLLDLALATVEPNGRLLVERARADFSTATDLADVLVRRAGLSFRDAHQIVAGVVREAMELGLRADGIRGELVDRVSQRVVGRPLHVPADELADALDPVRSVERRATAGGPAPREVRRMVQTSLTRVRDEERVHAVRLDRVAKGRRQLDQEVGRFLRRR